MESTMKAKQAVHALSALAHENRLSIYRMLVEAGPEGLNAGTIATRLRLPPSSLTFHLQHLHRVGLVTQERNSRQLIYAADFGVMKRARRLSDRELLRRRALRDRVRTVRTGGEASETRGKDGIGEGMATEPIHARPSRQAAVLLLEAASLPAGDLTDAHMEHFFFSGAPSSPSGIVGLELCGQLRCCAR
jgi:DNA-binding transcriptional ArsR family regulator